MRKLLFQKAASLKSLYLMSRRPLCHDDVPGALDHSHTVGVEQLAVALPALPELELEPALLVKDLDAVVVGVRHHDVVLGIDSHATGLGELAFKDTEFAEFAMIHHFLPLDLGLGRETIRRRGRPHVVAARVEAIGQVAMR